MSWKNIFFRNPEFLAFSSSKIIYLENPARRAFQARYEAHQKFRNSRFKVFIQNNVQVVNAKEGDDVQVKCSVVSEVSA